MGGSVSGGSRSRLDASPTHGKVLILHQYMVAEYSVGIYIFYAKCHVLVERLSLATRKLS